MMLQRSDGHSMSRSACVPSKLTNNDSYSRPREWESLARQSASLTDSAREHQLRQRNRSPDG